MVAQASPLDGTHAANWERWGTGGLDVDAMRVPLNRDTVPETVSGPCDWTPGHGHPPPDRGRWPRNVAHDGSDAVLGELPDSDGCGAGDRILHARYVASRGELGLNRRGPRDSVLHGDGSGSAARFFYQAKPSRSEREAGLDGLDEVAPHLIQGRSEGSAGSENPRAGIRGRPRRNVHPTCKPIELFRWLIRGFAPVGGLVLDPFLGSGTTAIAALLEGRRWIGIEREPEYAAIARARIEWWARECARKPGRSVAEVLGESRPVRAVPQRSRQAELW